MYVLCSMVYACAVLQGVCTTRECYFLFALIFFLPLPSMFSLPPFLSSPVFHFHFIFSIITFTRVPRPNSQETDQQRPGSVTDSGIRPWVETMEPSTRTSHSQLASLSRVFLEVVRTPLAALWLEQFLPPRGYQVSIVWLSDHNRWIWFLIFWKFFPGHLETQTFWPDC